MVNTVFEGLAGSVVSCTMDWCCKRSMVCAHARRRFGTLGRMIAFCFCSYGWRRSDKKKGSSSWSDEMKEEFAGVALDVLLGAFAISLLAYVFEFRAQDLGDWAFLNFGHLVQSGVMRRRVEWILSAHAPLGFKLNRDVDQLLGNMSLLIIDIWHIITSNAAPLAPYLVMFVCAAVFLGGGVTMLLAFSFDFLFAVTIHVWLPYMLFARIYRGLVSLGSTLLLLMRGRKINTLGGESERQRFTRQETLLAALAFIIILFVVQTCAAHYFVFAVLWLLIFSVASTIWFLTAFALHVPLASIAYPDLRKSVRAVHVERISAKGVQWKERYIAPSAAAKVSSAASLCFALLRQNSSFRGLFKQLISGSLLKCPPPQMAIPRRLHNNENMNKIK